MEIAKLDRVILLLIFACLLTAGVHAKQPVQGPVKKTCGTGIVLKLSAAAASQGSLLLAEISGVKRSQELSAEWDGRPIPVWRDTPASPTPHVLLGVDLAKPACRYDWRLSWTCADGQSCASRPRSTLCSGKISMNYASSDKRF